MAKILLAAGAKIPRGKENVIKGLSEGDFYGNGEFELADPNEHIVEVNTRFARRIATLKDSIAGKNLEKEALSAKTKSLYDDYLHEFKRSINQKLGFTPSVLSPFQQKTFEEQAIARIAPPKEEEKPFFGRIFPKPKESRFVPKGSIYRIHEANKTPPREAMEWAIDSDEERLFYHPSMDTINLGSSPYQSYSKENEYLTLDEGHIEQSETADHDLDTSSGSSWEEEEEKESAPDTTPTTEPAERVALERESHNNNSNSSNSVYYTPDIAMSESPETRNRDQEKPQVSDAEATPPVTEGKHWQDQVVNERKLAKGKSSVSRLSRSYSF